jgi:hypothetical protein
MRKEMCPGDAKEDAISEEANATKKKPSSLHWDNRKDALRTSQECRRSANESYR